MQGATAFSVAVFAYNEANIITRCLDSIRAAAGSHDTTIHVLINGCTDETERVVGQYAGRHANVLPIVISLGDKANAWNHYVHDIAPDADIHCFIDGDMTISIGSLDGLVRCFAQHPDATAAAGLPMSGRSMKDFRDKLIRNHELAGNFYALRGSAIRAFREHKVRLPTGMFGEDGLVATLIKWDLQPLGDRNDSRIVPCPDAGFIYDSLLPFVPAHWRIYRNRQMRYAVRRYQANMLYGMLFEQGISALPADVVDLYRAGSAKLRLQWNGLRTLFDYLALRRIKKKLADGRSATTADEARHYS